MEDDPLFGPRAQLLGAYWMDSPVLRHCDCARADDTNQPPDPQSDGVFRVVILGLSLIVIGAALASVIGA